ncbi:MAG: leucine-rich repeat protein, partial [Lachnospiraceae bacterium]|nr:leucine-rich repeat protein [Lachnospiraceae bacterium]
TMGDYALQETVITTFEIPKKMTKFSPQILFGNTSLSELKVASGNTAFIAEDGVLYTKDKSTLVLFPVNKAVTQFTVPTGVKQIGDYAFSKTRNLKSVRFSNVTTLGEGAFYDSSLSGALVLTDKITTAGSFAFDSCTEITSVKFGKGLKESPYRMFEACSSIKTIDFGGLQTLGMRTFCDCSSLVNVTLPDRMKKWGGSVFNSCSSLKTFTAKGLETIGYADFAQCYALETVNLSKVKTIYRQAFANCPSLTSITLPASTQYVDENAFEAGVQVNCLNKELVKFGKNGLHYAEKITISGTRDYKKAFEVLSIVNKKRAENGLSALTMDSSLLETAMIRAGEQEVLFSHTRPDGAACFSANAAMIAENVAINQRSASEVMNSWMNSEGHRENILSKDATTIGIGCFYMDGVYTWAQCFGNAENPQAAAKPANQTVSQSMYIPNGTFSEAITSRGIIWNTPKEYTYQFSIGIDSAKCQVGKKTQAKLWLINPEFGQKVAFSSKNITWVSGNTKIAKTDAKGKVSFVGSGNVTITGKTKYYQTSVKIKVKDNGKTSTKKSSKVVLKDKYAIYTGKAIKIGKAKATGSKGKVTYTYYTDAKCKKKLKNYPKKVGTYYVRAKVAATSTHKSAQSNIAKLVIQKKNPMTVKVKSKTYKAKASTGKLAKNYSFKIGVTKAKGTVTYSKSKNCKKYITVNNKGKVTIKKGTPRGKYTINVKAKGKGTYASRTIKVSIKVE